MSEKLTRHMGAVSFATLLSRILGYVRDALVAHAFGGGPLTDAFYAAFRLSNLFRRMLGEGPLSTAFVPVFSEHVAKHEETEARAFFQTLFTSLGVLLALVSALTCLGAPWIVSFAAHGFQVASPEKFQLTITLTRQLAPFLFFVCLAAVSAAALNAKGDFFIPSLAPAMLSVATIFYILFIRHWTVSPMQGLAISTTVGGAMHLLMLLPYLSKKNLMPRWRWNPRHPDVVRVTLLVVPAIWGLSIDQINAYVDTIFASFLPDGSVTALYNSNRLMQFALALFGTAVSTATLPHLARCVAVQDWKGMKENLNYSLRLTFFAVIPATAGLCVLGFPIVKLLFEHGRFTRMNTLYTTSALIAYTIGLPAYSAVKILVSAFYSMKDTKTPVKVATLCLFVNMIGILLFMRRWGVGGLAFATALASMVNATVLTRCLRKRIGLIGGRRILRTCLQSSAASVIMAGAAWSLVRYLPTPAVVRVPAAVFLGTAIYALLARFWGMEELTHVMAVIRRPKKEAEGEIIE
jgi:putative peptidoglycan lipid II flippase